MDVEIALKFKLHFALGAGEHRTLRWRNFDPWAALFVWTFFRRFFTFLLGLSATSTRCRLIRSGGSGASGESGEFDIILFTRKQSAGVKTLANVQMVVVIRTVPKDLVAVIAAEGGEGVHVIFRMRRSVRLHMEIQIAAKLKRLAAE